MKKIFTLALLCLTMIAGPALSLKDEAQEEAATAKASANPQVIMETSKGRIVIELNPDKAPVTVANFLSYVNEGFYDGTIFHRVVLGFVIQGGGFTENIQRKPPKDPIVNEAKNGLSNTKYTISMARTGDPNSATSQFFISTADNSSSLDPGGVDPHGYAVFGKVVEGMEVVTAIGEILTTNGRTSDGSKATVITKASVKK